MCAVCDNFVKIGNLRGLIELSNNADSGTTSYIGTAVLFGNDTGCSAGKSGEFKPMSVGFVH